MIDLRDGELLDLLKQTAFVNDIEVQSISYALKQEIDRILRIADSTLTQTGIDAVPERILDVLAVENDTPYYREDMDIDTKRRVIKNTFRWNMKGGTTGAMQELVNVVFGQSEVLEWFDYDDLTEDDVGTFMIMVQCVITEDMIEYFLSTVDQIKNARSHLRRIVSELSADLDDVSPTIDRKKIYYKGIEIYYIIRYFSHFNHSEIERIAANAARFTMEIDFWGKTLHNGVYLHDGTTRHGQNRSYGLAAGFHAVNRIFLQEIISGVARYYGGKTHTSEQFLAGNIFPAAITESERKEAGFSASASAVSSEAIDNIMLVIRPETLYYHDGANRHDGTIRKRNSIMKEVAL